MSRNHSDREDRLQELLRRGDPAADEGLTPDEIHAMRRAVLTAAPEPRRRSLLLPAFVAACGVLFALGLWWLGGRELVVEPPREASVIPPMVTPAPPQPPPVETIAQADPSPSVAVRSTRPRVPHPPLAPRDEPHSRQVQFSTPGGTRVVWVLTTDDVL
jgi:hypothetical protein